MRHGYPFVNARIIGLARVFVVWLAHTKIRTKLEF